MPWSDTFLWVSALIHDGRGAELNPRRLVNCTGENPAHNCEDFPEPFSRAAALGFKLQEDDEALKLLLPLKRFDRCNAALKQFRAQRPKDMVAAIYFP